MLATSISCPLCSTLYNPFGMSDKQLVHWKVGAAAVQQSGVEVPFEAPEKVEAEIEAMDQDGPAESINTDDPRVV